MASGRRTRAGYSWNRDSKKENTRTHFLITHALMIYNNTLCTSDCDTRIFVVVRQNSFDVIRIKYRICLIYKVVHIYIYMNIGGSMAMGIDTKRMWDASFARVLEWCHSRLYYSRGGSHERTHKRQKTRIE